MKSLIASLALILSACGGGGSSVAPEPAPNAPIQKPIIATYGDSTQAAQGNPHASTRDGWTIENKAVSGSYTQQLLDGTDGFNKAWAVEMLESKASVVVVNHGINDWRYPVAQYRENLAELVRVARLNSKFIILEMPNQTTTPESAPIKQAMRDEAAASGAYLCDQPDVPLKDWAHPTADGYAAKAVRLAKCIGDVL